MFARPALFALLAVLPLPVAAMPCAQVALVLAIDASASIDLGEYALQTEATGRALTDPEVVAAMDRVGGVVLGAVIWGDSRHKARRVDWRLVQDAEGAAEFAATLARQPRGPSGDTDLGRGVGAALDMLEDPSNCAHRRIVNVSGDGRETPLFRQAHRVTLAKSRERAARAGVVVNGLAMTGQDAGLGDYYRSKVAMGAESFVVEVAEPVAFASAMKRKLLREIGEPTLLSQLEPARLTPF